MAARGHRRVGLGRPAPTASALRFVFALTVTVLTAGTTPSKASTGPTYEILDFADLRGWDHDNHDAALEVFRNTCNDFDDPDWRALCKVAETGPRGRTFFELFFRPVLITDAPSIEEPPEVVFTGYFEPELQGSRTRGGRYRFPVYKMPPEARETRPWLTRRQISNSDALQGRGLEIAWVDDAVELFFLQIQGSGRIKLPDGSYIRVGYGGANGHPYSSVGQEMVRRGILPAHRVSAQVIAKWVRDNPSAGQELLNHNDSYVFFREVSEVPADRGPLGAMNRSITSMRSVAIDPKFTPLGAPVWIEKAGKEPMRRLMIAQDTGSAIKGAQRADIFIGTGDEAGRTAGQLRDPGRVVVLLPIQRAYSLLPEAVK